MSATPDGFADDIPPIGSYVVDRKSERILVVMDHQGGELYLRPPGGGIEITRKPAQLRPADRAETLRGRVIRANAEAAHECAG